MTSSTETVAARSQRVAQARAAFKSIVLPYPRQNVLMAELDELRLTGLETKGEPQDGLRLLAHTGSGKTFGAHRYVNYVESQPDRVPGRRPVLLVGLKTTGTPKSLFSCILAEMGDDYATTGTEETLRARVKRAFEIEGTELLIVDEINHLDRRTFGDDVTETLKSFLDEGQVPIAFLGTHKADDLFNRNKELNGRLTAPCSLPPLEWAVDEDRELFTQFATRLDEAMVEKGILPIESGLGEAWLAKLLCEVSNGNIGQFCRIVRTAMIKVVRRRGESIDYQDLSDAVNSWSIPNGFRSDNPLEKVLP